MAEKNIKVGCIERFRVLGSKVQMKSSMNKFFRYLPLGLAVGFTVLGVYQFLNLMTYRALESETQKLQREVQVGDRLVDHAEAVTHYQGITPEVTEVQLRILQRQWLIALDYLHQIQATRYNKVLQKEFPLSVEQLHSHLEDMHDRCSEALARSEPLPPGLAWRLYNISGCLKLLKAFIVLETEENWKKITGVMREAISDLKTAIEQVDAVHPITLEANIPRWNLELLHSEQFVKLIVRTQADAERRLDLRENLEAIIPEKGGYAPGEPLQRKIRK